MLDAIFDSPLSQPLKTYGKGICGECGLVVSTYTEPQPITGVRLCNRHWTLPPGYCYSAELNVIKERVRD